MRNLRAFSGCLRLPRDRVCWSRRGRRKAARRARAVVRGANPAASSPRRVGARSCAIREEEIREEEIREESRRVAALAESERDEPDAVEDDGNIPMFPIGAPLSHSDPNGGESPPHQYRRVSYLID